MYKNSKGITLIALVITIIVLLILAGVSISTLAGDNGLLTRTTTAKEKTESAGKQEELQTAIEALKIDYYANRTTGTIGEYLVAHESDLKRAVGDSTLSVNGNKITYKGQQFTVDDTTGKVANSGGTTATITWTQSGTSVTDGKITLTVGTQVTGYSVTGHTDLNWYVLGAKDGKLLITTNTCPETVNLAGTAGFTNVDGKGCPWVTTLNTAAANYSDGDMADSTRTIDYDDIKRIAPNLVNSNVGEVYEYGNKVTYTLKASSVDPDDMAVWYQGTKQPTTEIETSELKFEYWGERPENQWNWISLGKGQSSPPLECTYESYSAGSMANNNAYNESYSLLFTNTGDSHGAEGSYWVGCPYVKCSVGIASYGLYCVENETVSGYDLLASTIGSRGITMGLRPVVSLKSSVKVTDAGVLSK